MDKPTQIPDLRSLLGRGRGAHLRGRGRATAGNPADDPGDPTTRHTKGQDKIVQETDDDASVSRMSAVELGYLDDPFAADLTRHQTQRRFPIINRGTYVRTTAVDKIVHDYLQTSPSTAKQIISLGAGSDTRYFRMTSDYPNVPLLYHELDFPTVTSRKISLIKKSPRLMNTINARLSGNEAELALSEDDGSLYSPTYNIHPVDLRDLHGPSDEGEMKLLRNVDTNRSTLIISECCLVYLPPHAADQVLQYFTCHLFPETTSLYTAIYEPINPDDSFGRVMVQNLAARGIVLQTIQEYGTLSRQKRRLENVGFTDSQEALDISMAWDQWVIGPEKERISKLEMLDEVEEWNMLAKHYCIAWGSRTREI